jgi:glycosyltransferase involved in cell wall biosynthesis
MEESKLNLSVIIIAKNEAKRIKSCLDSVKEARQIILVNNKSTDDTVEIAQKFNAEIIHTDSNDFSQLRNIGLQKVKFNWVFYLDADEIATPELISEIASIISHKDIGIDTYFVRRVNYYLGNNIWPGFEKIQRLFWKKSLKGWYGKLHESPDIIGNVGLLIHPILHFTHRNLTEMIAKTNKWSDTEAKLRFDSGHPQIVSWRLIRVMITGFCKSFFYDKGYKAGTTGMIESIYQAFSMFITYAKLWELQRIHK